MKPVAAPLAGLILFATALPFLAGLVPLVRFTEERIDIRAFPEYVIVSGEYAYRNPWPVPLRQGLWLPLPIDPGHPPPALVSVNRMGRHPARVPVIEFKNRFWFELSFRSKETVWVKVAYRQRTVRRQARYILTTTRPWRRPLEGAVYRLAPHGVNIVHSNYPLRRVSERFLGFERRHFMPDKDWVFSWEVRP